MEFLILDSISEHLKQHKQIIDSQSHNMVLDQKKLS